MTPDCPHHVKHYTEGYRAGVEASSGAAPSNDGRFPSDSTDFHTGFKTAITEYKDAIHALIPSEATTDER